ncbi:ceramide synthase-like [Anser cygnoides]|uniref:ceramide synthase-like n=1 Tax=Anser cygnoides TaxID=8845 RepID=UPI0034D2F7D0
MAMRTDVLMEVHHAVVGFSVVMGTLGDTWGHLGTRGRKRSPGDGATHGGHHAVVLVGFSVATGTDVLMEVHHAAMVLVCFPVATLWRQGKGDFFLGCLLMAELSTPFVCLGKVLILYNRQHTALHKLNGVAMLVTFLGCRVLLFPYLYWA